MEAGFYSDVVECLPVNPATWVRFPAGTGKIFSLYDNLVSKKEEHDTVSYFYFFTDLQNTWIPADI